MLLPSVAVTTIVMLLLPTSSAIADEAEPLLTTVPFTVMLAPLLLAVGVTVKLATALLRLTV